MSAQQLRDYRDEYYAPNNVVFLAVGDVKHEDFVAVVAQKYGHLKPTNFPDLPTPDYVGGTAHIEFETMKLCSVFISGAGVSNLDDDHTAYEVLGDMLGDGQSSPLNRKIVDELQWASSVEAGHISYRNTGNFYAFAQVAADKVKPLIAEIYSQIREMAENPDAGALARVKAAKEMDILSGMETSRDACDAYGNNALDHDRMVLADEALEAVRSVRLEDIQRVARTFLASNPTIASVVPPGTDKALLPDHAEIVGMRDGQISDKKSTTPMQAPKAPKLT